MFEHTLTRFGSLKWKSHRQSNLEYFAYDVIYETSLDVAQLHNNTVLYIVWLSYHKLILPQSTHPGSYRGVLILSCPRL